MHLWSFLRCAITYKDIVFGSTCQVHESFMHLLEHLFENSEFKSIRFVLDWTKIWFLKVLENYMAKEIFIERIQRNSRTAGDICMLYILKIAWDVHLQCSIGFPFSTPTIRVYWGCRESSLIIVFSGLTARIWAHHMPFISIFVKQFGTENLGLRCREH